MQSNYEYIPKKEIIEKICSQIILYLENYNDKLIIELDNDDVVFNPHIDGTGNVFIIKKKILLKLLEEKNDKIKRNIN